MSAWYHIADPITRSWGVDYPWVLALAALALLPFLANVFNRQGIPTTGLIPPDPISRALGIALKLAGALAILALVVGLAGLHRREQTVIREGTGAHLVLLLDRSSSMDNNFADRAPSGDEQSKSSAAKHLLGEFVAGRPHDRIGVAAFSTSPMPVLPLTDHHQVVQAAIDAIDRPGLAFTNVGRGLALALSAFADDTAEASRAILLVSDGAALIDRRVQDALRDAVARTPVHLYWLFLRSRGAKGIFEVPPPGEDTPQANPERHLHLFLQSLGVPYRAFEATSPQAVGQAIAEINRQETRPLTYVERIPRRDLARTAFSVAAAGIFLILLAKCAERPLRRHHGPAAAPANRTEVTKHLSDDRRAA
ncbi:vWA domain-containing protein [Ancylobacter sp. SL191]|uniref:vWA domain-containing protein n=1 Tax=Ancylobacter sp. SL191 TaxID=2995166 RepID=UPI002271842D|nr:vWA domain-containing protein [Ancylobacter sp. SL191]WAC26226.1 VWA domain-containing protein [Ancylobacter sp. SL191]